MNLKRLPVVFPVIVLALLVGLYFLLISGRPAPIPLKKQIASGITYKRMVSYFPHSMISHVIIIDRKTESMFFFVTPPDDVDGGAVKARTTSQFLKEFDLKIAINGDGFFPWWSRSPLDYYPKAGDSVTPNGFSASRGKIYADGLQDERAEPTLYINRRNELTFNHVPNNVYMSPIMSITPFQAIVCCCRGAKL